MYKQSVSSRALNVIMGKPTKDNVARFALSLDTVEEVQEATNSFHRQGVRLWGFWCRAMLVRMKENKPVPAIFRDR